MPARSSTFASIGFLGASVAGHVAALLFAVAGSHAGKGHIGAEPNPEAHAQAIGDTFEIPTDEVDGTETVMPSAAGDPSPAGASATPPEAANAPSPPDPAETKTPRRRRHVAAKRTSATPDGTSASDDAQLSTARYGALGERAAAPLAATFTRGFPQAASADPLWLTAPLGSAGTALVDLTIDEQGALVATQVSGTGAQALTEGVRRTLALIRARSFVAAGRVTRLKVTATITPDEVHDGLHGEVFAIGGTFDDAQGNGFFALAVGRRIDVKVQVVRAMP